MSEQQQTEEKGSVALPLAAAAVDAYGVRHVYQKAANSLADAAANAGHLAEGAKAAPEALQAAAKEVLAADAALAESFTAAKVLQEEGRIAALTGVTVEKAVGEGAKGFDVTFHHPGEKVSRISGVEKLPESVKKVMGEASSVKVQGDALQALTRDGAKSWVGKTAQKAEQGVAQAIRKSEPWKRAGGGMKAAFSHASGAGKAGIVVGSVVAAAGIYAGVKNLFSSPHTARVEADRAAPEASAGRA